MKLETSKFLGVNEFPLTCKLADDPDNITPMVPNRFGGACLHNKQDQSTSTPQLEVNKEK